MELPQDDSRPIGSHCGNRFVLSPFPQLAGALSFCSRLGGIAANLSEREAGAGNREGNANVDGSEAAVATEAEETFEDAQELLPTTVGRTTRKRGRPPPPVTAAAAAPLPPRTTRRGVSRVHSNPFV